MTTLAIQDPKFAITPTGIQFHQDLSFAEWDDLGQKLAPIGKSIGFIIGDWINYGEGRYGEKYAEALERSGMAYQTLMNYSYVARKVEISCRQENLGFEHHAVVAKLKPDEQEHWLEMTKAHSLSVRRLRKSINFGRLATDEEVQGDPADRGHVTYLAQARSLGASLIVAANSDASVTRLGKGDDRPLNPLTDRMALLASLECVSLVTWFDEDTPLERILDCRPDVLVKGGDWNVDANNAWVEEPFLNFNLLEWLISEEKVDFVQYASYLMVPLVGEIAAAQ